MWEELVQQIHFLIFFLESIGSNGISYSSFYLSEQYNSENKHIFIMWKSEWWWKNIN